MTLLVACLGLFITVALLLVEVMLLRRDVKQTQATAEFAVRAVNVILAAQREDMRQGRAAVASLLRPVETARNTEPRAPGGMGVLPLKNPGHKPVL